MRLNTNPPQTVRAGGPAADARAGLRAAREWDLMRSIDELVQRGRMIVELAAADLHAAEAAYGTAHEITWRFRNQLNEARVSWSHLCAELGPRAIERALSQPPASFLALEPTRSGRGDVNLFCLEGTTFRATRSLNTARGATEWHLASLASSLAEGLTRPRVRFTVSRARDGSRCCDCAEVRGAEGVTHDGSHCKHVRALLALGWI